MAATCASDRGAFRRRVRAHLATFPPRAAILRRVIDAMLPQVDHLYLVLNGYDAVPQDLAGEARITAVVPDRDLRDAGKFHFTPDPDEIVFLIDDDLRYPPDYVARSIASADAIGWDGNAFGYMANSWRADGGGWAHTRMRAPVTAASGVRLLGTGTTVARGDMIPPLSAVEPFHGHADIAFAHWLADRGGRAWLLPRPADWLSSDLPPELLDSSLFVTDAPQPPLPVTRLLDALVGRPMPHDGAVFNHTHRRAAPVAAAAKEA